jgi:c(7)-type cytochrome triheme protein
MYRNLWFGVLSVVLAATSAWAVMGGGDISFPVEGMATVVYSHEDHVGRAKLKCGDCHYKLYTNHAQHKAVGMEGMRKGQSCGACHNGSRAFNVASPEFCSKCHK